MPRRARSDYDGLFEAGRGEDPRAGDFQRRVEECCIATEAGWDELRTARPTAQHEHICGIVEGVASQIFSELATRTSNVEQQDMARQGTALLAQRGAAAAIGVARSVSEEGGAFACVSGPACACGSLRFVAHAQVRHFGGRAGELRAILTQWGVVARLLCVQRRLRVLARARARQRIEVLVQELAAAERQRAMSKCWRLARLIAGVGAGPRGRIRIPL